MSTLHMPPSGLEAGLRWTARLLAGILVGLVLLIFVGDGASNLLTLKPAEALQMTVFLTTCVGLVIAWRKPFLGGAIATGGILLFFAVEIAGTGKLPTGLVFPLILLTGILFLLSAFIRRRMT